MPEVLGAPPSPRTALFWNGTEWQWALVDAAGQLQVDVIASGLPAGAATAAAQALALAQLQLIEDLRDALQSVATDRLIVRGEDQLFSIDAVVADQRNTVLAAGHMWADSAVVPAGFYWVLTNVAVIDVTTATTAHEYTLWHDAAGINFNAYIQAFAIAEWSDWHGHLYLDAGDSLRVYFVGGLVGDTCIVAITGYQMTLEV